MYSDIYCNIYVYINICIYTNVIYYLQKVRCDCNSLPVLLKGGMWYIRINSPRLKSSCSNPITVKVKDGFPTRDYHVLKPETCPGRIPPNLEKHASGLWIVLIGPRHMFWYWLNPHVLVWVYPYFHRLSLCWGNPSQPTLPVCGAHCRTDPLHSTRDSRDDSAYAIWCRWVMRAKFGSILLWYVDESSQYEPIIIPIWPNNHPNMTQ